jgi:hypothetical protein
MPFASNDSSSPSTVCSSSSACVSASAAAVDLPTREQNSIRCGAYASDVSRNDTGSAYRREPGTNTSPERSPSHSPTSTHSSQ